MSGSSDPKNPIFDVEISDEDIYEAMKDIPGYLDITLGDLKEIYFSLGYLYAVIPAGLGAIVMLLVALLVNNIPRTRRYPEFWL